MLFTVQMRSFAQFGVTRRVSVCMCVCVREREREREREGHITVESAVLTVAGVLQTSI